MDKENCFKILIVEDDEISRSIYRLMLKNYDLSFCDSDKTMYEKLSNNNFQLIIMDIGLPNSKDGLVLIKELKDNKDYCKIPIICATSYDSQESKANAISVGADVYLSKPVLRDILVDTITTFQS